MRILIKETIWNFRQSLVANILIIAQLAVCFWLICMLSNSFFDMGFKNHYKDDMKGEKIYYESAFYKSVLMHSAFMDAKDLDNAKDLIKELRSNKDFIYTRYASEQSIYVNKQEFEKRSVQDEDINKFIYHSNPDPNILSLSSTQMDKLGFEYFNYKMYMGRAFKAEDYILESKDDSLPIILGYNYKDIFKVGDSIKYTYSGKEMEGEIVGILEEGSNYFTGNTKSFLLDDRIILPIPDFQYTAEDPEENIFQAGIYTNLLGGANLIASKDSSNINIAREFYDLCNKYDFMKYDPSITATTNGLAMFKGESEKAVKLIFIMIVVMVIFCIFTFVMSMYNKVEKNMRRYLIQILQGASINYILGTFLLEIFTVIIISMGLSGYLLRKEMTVSYIFLLLLILLAAIVAVITGVTITYRFRNLDSDKLLRRE